MCSLSGLICLICIITFFPRTWIFSLSLSLFLFFHFWSLGRHKCGTSHTPNPTLCHLIQASRVSYDADPWFKVSAKFGKTRLSHTGIGPFCVESDTQYHLKHKLGRKSVKLGQVDRYSKLTRMNHPVTEINNFFPFQITTNGIQT